MRSPNAELRGHLLGHLFERSDFTEPTELIANVPEAQRDRVQAWFQRIRDGLALRHLLQKLEPSVQVPPVERVVAILNGERVQRLRSMDDLFTLLMEELSKDADARTYVELVRRGSKKSRSWEHEPTLQAFVLLRVHEILRRSIPHQRDVVHREVQEHAGKDIPDLLVVPANRDVEASDSAVELPIEVKWSHNSECLDALVDQLAERYVRDKRRTHGIYVVGFSGEPPNADLDSLRAELTARREMFEEAHREIRLGVVLVRFVP